MAFDLVIDVENTPGALAKVAAAVSDAGVNIAAATCIGTGERAEVHILVPHAEAAKHSLAISHLSATAQATASTVHRRSITPLVYVTLRPTEVAIVIRRSTDSCDPCASLRRYA